MEVQLMHNESNGFEQNANSSIKTDKEQLGYEIYKRWA